ncbi:preprotein translocase subunit SecE [Spiroplasma endosymbiont of Labia minor]|uniref:preprotein translocase subunit SecE n=1 Tax=Spiroplasma endosymbiont of Labia minor TaxID=3066305 RepID=UPI0030D3F90A
MKDNLSNDNKEIDVIEKNKVKQKLAEQKAQIKLQKQKDKESVRKLKNNLKITKAENLNQNDETLSDKEIRKRAKKEQELAYKNAAAVKLKKTEKDKINWKQTIREFPAAMTKEVLKIRWGTASSLGFKFLITIIFLALSAVFFFLIDWGLQELFTLMHVL